MFTNCFTKQTMPFWGLVFTSSLFAIPTIIAARRKKHLDALCIGSVMTTSIVYHATQHPLAHSIDKALVHAVSYGYGGVAATKKPSPVLTSAIASHLLCGLIYYKKSQGSKTPTSPFWHMVVHGCGLVTSLLLVHS